MRYPCAWFRTTKDMTALAIYLGFPVAGAVLILPTAVWAEATVRLLALTWLTAAIIAIRFDRRRHHL